MSTFAFGMFLSIISINNVTVDENRVSIHTPQNEVHWLSYGDQWCTGAPGGLDVMARSLMDTSADSPLPKALT
jgi:hypothetical protein